MESPYRQLARYLQAAFLADRLGVTFQTALNRYLPKEPGQMWLELAEALSKRGPWPEKADPPLTVQ